MHFLHLVFIFINSCGEVVKNLMTQPELKLALKLER